jgi:hypothetical protein
MPKVGGEGNMASSEGERSQPITHIIMDNEKSDMLEGFFTDNNITVPILPKGQSVPVKSPHFRREREEGGGWAN